MKNIFITRDIPTIGTELLRQNGFEVTVWNKAKAPTQSELIKELKKREYDAVISLLTDKIDANVFDAAPKAKIFANYAAGFNNIDVDEAKRRGIAITNVPGVSNTAVAEHTVAHMLALTTRLVESDAFMRKGKYKGWEPMAFLGTDLHDKTLGLIGVGGIGSEVARMAHNGFGIKVIYYDVAENKGVEEKYGATRISTVEELLRTADIVSLHVPLLDSTHHLINAERLSLMKPSAFLVNTSRGPVIDEKALVHALKSGKIRGAGLDVFEFEPKLASGLSKLPNVVITPHTASARESVRNDMAKVAAENVIDCLEGKTPKNRVG